MSTTESQPNTEQVFTMRILLTLLILAVHATAQLSWAGKDIPSRHSHAIAYDSNRKALVVFGGTASGSFADTWERIGTSWRNHALTIHPQARVDHAMVYDPSRKVVVLFGGSNSTTVTGDTWEWDGASWTQRNPPSSPPNRSLHAMCYDSSRRKILIFGGWDSQTFLNDTWAWNGTDWKQVKTSRQPSPRARHAMTFDSLRGRAIMFGGETIGGAVSDRLWEFDGSQWIKMNPATSPAGRRDFSLVYDPSKVRTTLYGGRTNQAAQVLQDRWEWDGNRWARIMTATPGGHTLHEAVYAGSGQTLVFGGITKALAFEQDSWTATGNSWRKDTAEALPNPRIDHGLTFDSVRKKMILFGGRDTQDFGDTWEWDGSIWAQQAPAQSPLARARHAIAFDAKQANTVLFGGFSAASGALFGDTWIWDGTNWARQFPIASPTARTETRMVFDSQRNRIILFGGLTSSGLLNDTWEWGGAVWTLRQPSRKPPVRIEFGMAFDPSTGKTILYGGRSASFKLLTDTWSWNGTNWTEIRHPTTPGPRFKHAMAYHPNRGRIVLFGGSSSNDTWEWTGSQWTRATPITDPTTRAGHKIAFDGQRIIMFGGLQGKPTQWQYHGGTQPAVVAIGSGCSNSKIPQIWTSRLPILGAPDFGIRVDQAAPNSVGLIGITNLPAAAPLPGGCTLYLVAPWADIPIVTDGSGHATIQFPIPQVSSLRGLILHSQAFVAEPGGPFLGLAAFSRGLSFRIGD